MGCFFTESSGRTAGVKRLAASAPRLDAVRCLVSLGTDVVAPTNCRFLPAELALERKNAEIFRYLCDESEDE